MILPTRTALLSSRRTAASLSPWVIGCAVNFAWEVLRQSAAGCAKLPLCTIRIAHEQTDPSSSWGEFRQPGAYFRNSTARAAADGNRLPPSASRRPAHCGAVSAQTGGNEFL